MKAQHRRIGASAAVILATLALTTVPPAQAEPSGGGAETDTSIVRPPQFGDCPEDDL
ncbi:hypothetical protein SAMN05444920_103865 [Nonomuraea solani]|uniref:Uncharacterized protein n=1 Tax=Nonomuraea solani TaxID=1144553 RepID=A0A1H6C387_9ACTN|nr:hypothetical protein [Nonomuraea solani]SEG67353.1 hypothetical protein SAMN05444920_103865 [Nonomuraea solani]